MKGVQATATMFTNCVVLGPNHCPRESNRILDPCTRVECKESNPGSHRPRFPLSPSIAAANIEAFQSTPLHGLSTGEPAQVPRDRQFPT